ncbi:MAG: hypothetical protein HDT15_11220 [Oscillibacter sp.]|nr:hypothetical protein [Oscillibacter sp.]
MKTAYRKTLLGTLAIVTVFLVCLYSVTIASEKQFETSVQDLQIQLGSASILNGSFYSEPEIKGRFQAINQLIELTELPESTWSAAYVNAGSGFIDVKAEDWFYSAVSWAVSEGITSGMTETQFGPDITCSNAQVLTFLWRACGKPVSSIANPFQDVTTSDYFYLPALWAYEQGLVSGSDFSPSKDCTRAMAVTYLWKAAGSPKGTVVASAQFADVSETSEISQAVAWAVENGITSGTSNTAFSPYMTCTRAQIVTFLYRDIPNLNTTEETVTLPSGISYIGRMMNGIPHGKGVLTIPDIGQYEGDFQAGKRSGTGTFTWSTGESFTGAWADDKISGTGTLTMSSGDTLIGTFSDNRISQGTYCFSEGYGTVEVPVSGGKLQTSAAVKISLVDGSSYSGPIVNGKLNGICTITFANGDSYVGNVSSNLKSGTGTYTWQNGAWYEGSWSEDEMSGEGTYYYTASATGERLYGTFSHNDPVDICTYFSASNTEYVTIWRDRQCISITRG